jgi:hypothetical protein
LEREVTIAPGSQHVEVELFPTSQYLNDYEASAQSQRTWAWVAVGAGGALVLGGGAFLLWNQGEKNEAEQRFEDTEAEIVASVPRGCDGASECQRLQSALDDLETTRDRDLYGWIGLGVGVAGMTTGLLLYSLGPDPKKYEPELEQDVWGSLRFDIGPGRASVSGMF